MGSGLTWSDSRASTGPSVRTLWVPLLLALLCGSLAAQQPVSRNITTVAGGGPTVIPQLNGAVNNIASTGEVGQIAWDGSHGVFYFTSSTFNRIYKYDPVAGQATVIAGNGLTGFRGDGGDPLQASFAGPLGLVINPSNPDLIYVADTGNKRVRAIDLAGNTVNTIAGDGTCVTGLLTYTDVPQASANICSPGQMAIDGNGVLYVFDLDRRVIWRMFAGAARMIAGNSAPGRPFTPVAAGVATAMSLGDFGYLAVDPAGQFLYLNETIGLRQLNLATGILSAPLDISANTPLLDVNGAPTGFNTPIQRVGSPVAVDPATGNVIYAIYTTAVPSSESIVSLNPTSGQTALIAGTGTNAPPFLTPTSNVSLGGMTNGLGELVAITPAGAGLGTLVASRSGWIHSMSSLSAGANFTTFLGNGFRSYCGDGGPATTACLDSPSSVFANSDGSFFIADTGNSVVRFVDTGGVIHSLVSPKTAGAPPTSLTVLVNGLPSNMLTNFGPPLPPGTLMFTSIPRRQVFTLNPVTDAATLYSGTGDDACKFFQLQGFCDVNADSGLDLAHYNQPRGILIDSLGNPYLAEPEGGLVVCLACTDPVVPIVGRDPITGAQLGNFGNPFALALDSDSGLLIAEKSTQKIQRIAPDPNHGYVTAFFPVSQVVTDVLNNRQLPLTNVTPLLPVGLTRIPGLLLASDDYSRIVWSTTRSPLVGPCPSGTTCNLPPQPPQVVAAFAGGGNDPRDNIQANLTAFGFRQVEAGVFDAQDSLGEISSAQVNGATLVFITDRADNRIRLVSTGGNHAPTANAGVDRNVPLDPPGFIANVLLDGSASSDPDGDALSYAWSENGNSLGTGAFVQTALGPGKHAITLTVGDGLGGTSSATVNITVTPPVDLALAATPSATTVNTGDTLGFSASVSNLGPNDATGVSVTLAVAASTDFVGGSAPGGACSGPPTGTAGSIRCPVGPLANGASASATIQVKPHVAGALASVLSASGDQGDPNLDNNSITINVAVNENSVQVNVSENIQVTDTVQVLPSAVLSDAEAIQISDTVNVLPSVMLSDAEAIQVTDAVTLLPSVMLSEPEVIQVTDAVNVLPSITLADSEAIQVSDAVNTLPSITLSDSEAIHVTDVVAVLNTPLGTPSVPLPDQNGNLSNVTVTFAGGVTAPGSTSVIIGPSGPQLPAQFQLAGNPPVYYDVQTTAQYAPPVIVCVALNPVPAGAALLHFNSATQQWENLTIQPVTAQGPICTQANSLSPFVVAVPSNRPPTANAGVDETVEATGPAGAVVTLSGSGSDPDNDPLTFTWSENGSTLGTGAQITVTLPIGTHSITLTADDGRGGTGTSTVAVTVQDTTPPKLALPGDITLVATSAAGANASFGASATDLVDGSVAVTCTPTPGSLFAVGATAVKCSATDAHRNTSTGSFTVTVVYDICLLYPVIARRSGSTYPIKLQLCTANGINLSSPAIKVHAIAVVNLATGAAVPLDDSDRLHRDRSDRDADFRYRPALAGYLFNLSLDDYRPGSYAVVFTAGSDPTRHLAPFRVK